MRIYGIDTYIWNCGNDVAGNKSAKSNNLAVANCSRK